MTTAAEDKPVAPQIPETPPAHYEDISTEGFPWTGLTLVLVVLGLIAFMAVPVGPVSPQELEAERVETSVRATVEELRHALREYAREHEEVAGLDPRNLTRREFRAAWLERQLLQVSDARGNTVPAPTPDHQLGPYLTEFPSNPLNGLTSVRIVDELDAFRPDDSTGWVYEPRTGEIRLNAPGLLRESNLRYFDL